MQLLGRNITVDYYSMESRCDECDPTTVRFQCFNCNKLDKAIRASQRESARKDQAAKRVCSEEKKKQDLFMSCVRSQFEIKSIPRDGHCLFSAFAAGYVKLTGTELSMREVREAVAHFLLASKGIVTADEGLTFDISDEKQQPFRGSAAAAAKKKKAKPLKKMSVEEYAEKVRLNLYGGDAEIAAMALQYDVTVHVYSWHSFHESNVFAPQVFNAGATKGTVALLFEQDFVHNVGHEDHYDTVISDKFRKWRQFMLAMPKWDIDGTGTGDIRVCESPGRGRGIQVLKEFKKMDVLQFYDGHRVDAGNGKLKVESAFLKDVYQKHGYDHEANTFHTSHALCLGRTHVTDLVIDGFHTTLECFDQEVFMGRGAMANSASAKQSNMMLVWVKSPNFPRDVVTKISDCDAFFLAKRDIM